MKPVEIKVKYFTDKIDRLEKIEQGGWIDLRLAEDVHMDAGEFRLLPLGVAMQLPAGYEAIVAPRSSTYKRFGIVQANSIGVIDNSYAGPEDMWKFPAIALFDTDIPANTRICQFRIQKEQPKLNFITVDELDNPSRGGIGSTGVN